MFDRLKAVAPRRVDLYLQSTDWEPVECPFNILPIYNTNILSIYFSYLNLELSIGLCPWEAKFLLLRD